MENPYNQNEQEANGVSASSVAQSSLYASKGWVRFISVLLFIYFAIMVVVLIGGILGMTDGGYSVILPFILLVMVVVLFILANRLSKYSSAISRAEISRDSLDLEAALVYQMKFWRLAGILTLIGVFVSILAIFIPALMI